MSTTVLLILGIAVMFLLHFVMHGGHGGHGGHGRRHDKRKHKLDNDNIHTISHHHHKD